MIFLSSGTGSKLKLVLLPLMTMLVITVLMGCEGIAAEHGSVAVWQSDPGASVSVTLTPKLEGKNATSITPPAPQPQVIGFDPMANTIQLTGATALTTVKKFVIRPFGLQLVNADGLVIFQIGYRSNIEIAVTVLTRVFGIDPKIEELPHSNHYPPATIYTWGNFVLQQDHPADFRYENAGQFGPRILFVMFLGPEEQGIILQDIIGNRVGDPWTSIVTNPQVTFDPVCGGAFFDSIVDIYAFSEQRREIWGDPIIGVDIRANEDSTVTKQMRSPVSVIEAGCGP